LRLSLSEYEEFTVGQFFNAWMGKVEWQTEKEKQEWERMNYIAYCMQIENPSRKQADKPKSFEAFMNAGKKAPRQLTKEEFESFLND